MDSTCFDPLNKSRACASATTFHGSVAQVQLRIEIFNVVVRRMQRILSLAAASNMHKYTISDYLPVLQHSTTNLMCELASAVCLKVKPLLHPKNADDPTFRQCRRYASQTSWDGTQRCVSFRHACLKLLSPKAALRHMAASKSQESP